MAPRHLKQLVFFLASLPLLWLGWSAMSGGLGANPIETITHFTGDWALRLLLLTLAVTPLRKLAGWKPVIQVRRMLGLFTFFYAALHFLTWLVLDQFFFWPGILEDIGKRPYITVGFAAFILLIPLAVTSTKGMMRRLGSRWKQLHKLVYVIAVLAVLHFLWLVKADLFEPLVYASILTLLLLARTSWVGRRRAAATTS